MTEENQLPPLGLRALPRKQIILTFAGVMLAMFLGSLDQTVVGTAMPRIISDLGGFTKYTWITTAYIITSAIAIPITGKLTDMYGRKWFYIAGIGIFVLSSIACGISNTMNEIIIFRGVQGIGAGVMMANAFTVVGDLFPPAVRGKYQGLMSAVFGISAIVGPTLGGYITDSLSWHWVFFVNVPLGILVITLFFFVFPDIKPDNLKHKIDFLGVSMLVFTVAPLLLALTWGGVEYAWNSPEIITMFVVAGVALGLFILAELKSKEPIIPLSLFKNQIVSISSVMIFLTGAGMFGAITFIPLFFQGVRGVSATSSGNYITPMMLGNVVGSFISGQVLARAGGKYRLQGAIGVAVMAVGLWMLSTVKADTANSVVIRDMIIAGFGLGVTLPLYTIAVQNAVPYKVLGVATSSAAFFRSLGGCVGLAVYGSVMNNQFASSLTAKLPTEFVNAVPQSQLNSLIHNPQALISAGAESQLKGFVDAMGPNGPSLFQQVLQSLKEALASSIGHVFLYALVAVIASFIVNWFIKEIPLRSSYHTDNSQLIKKSK